MPSIRAKEIERDRLMASGMTLHEASRELGITQDDLWKHIHKLARKEKREKKRGRKPKRRTAA